MFFDPVYLIFLLPGVLLALWASLKTRTASEHYSQVPCASGMSGAQAAARLLADAGVTGVRIEETSGFLSDHYDPTARVLRLSPSVYRERTLAAVGVACHEAGHAIQHATNYGPLGLRSFLVPAVSISSPGAYICLFLGFLFQAQALVWLGILFFLAAVIFSLVTLPVEFDATRRAKQLMVRAGIVSNSEAKGAGEVLDAAFLTYVASAVSMLLTLLYYLYRAGAFSRRD